MKEMTPEQKKWAEENLTNLTYSEVGRKYKGHPNFFSILSAWSETHSIQQKLPETPKIEPERTKQPEVKDYANQGREKKISQADKLLELLSDYQPHPTTEILEIVYGGEHKGIARIGARINDLKNKGYQIKSWPDREVKTIWHYQLIKG